MKSVHDAFLAFCQRAETEHAIAVGRYVLMPDHVHFFVFLPEQGVRLSRWVGQLKRAMGNAAGTEHVTWQEGFFEHRLRETEDVLPVFLYIYLNPYKAGLILPAQATIARLKIGNGLEI